MLFVTLLLSICAIAAVVYLLRAVWSMAEALANGIVGGVVLFWRLARWTMRTTWRDVQWIKRTAIALDTWLSQRAHATWWSYSYWLKRNYIASVLRHRRKGRHL